jgi:hypothetical protein
MLSVKRKTAYECSGFLRLARIFRGWENADFFAPAIEDTKNLIVPVICIYEVFKRIRQQRGINEAQQHIGDMKLGQVIDIDESLALSVAKYRTT